LPSWYISHDKSTRPNWSMPAKCTLFLLVDFIDLCCINFLIAKYCLPITGALFSDWFLTCK
jgi:hypothetical protein